MSGGDSLSNDSLFELEFMESLHQKLPKDKRVMTLLAELYTAYGKIDEGLLLDKKIVIEKAKKFLKKYSLKDTVSLILETERLNKKEIYKLCLMVKNEKKN